MDVRLAALAACALWSACSGNAGGPRTECRARSERASLSDGCYCEIIGDGGTSTSYPKVASCDNHYAGPSTICCRSGASCVCVYVGCSADSLVNTCDCGPDKSAILSDQTDVSSCSLPPSGRCCASQAEGFCSCDTASSGCPDWQGYHAVSSCTAATVPPRCGSLGDEVDSCDNLSP